MVEALDKLESKASPGRSGSAGQESAGSAPGDLRDSTALNPSEILWPASPADFELVDGQVHVWAFVLNLPADHLETGLQSLNAQEQERAKRFRFDIHRNRFIAGRSALRALLGRYCGISPEKIEFVYGTNGKPALGGTGQKQGIGFNLAHTEDLALLAVRPGGEIGVDVERIRAIPDMEELVARFFSANENALFKTLPVRLRGAAFFNLWTRKEAWLKATGEGIASSLRSVEVSFLPGEPARLVRIEGQPEAPGRWRLEDMKPAAGFAAAFAIPAETAEVSCRRWPLEEIRK